MNFNNYDEGAYYYNELEFAWSREAWMSTPSIYSLQDKKQNSIKLPFIKDYMKAEQIPVMYVPFTYENLNVIVSSYEDCK